MDLFTVHLPRSPAVPVVANLPHSGLALTATMKEQLLPAFLEVLPHTDWHLDRLYESLPDLGITMLQANYSRYCVDLNRSLQRPWFGSFWRSVVAAETAFGQPLYQIQPSRVEICCRVKQYYQPYHAKLRSLLRETIARFGRAYLLDLHSFLGLIPDPVCLGNADGQTCSVQFMDTVERSFRQQGYEVVRNKVFSGGYITRHYGALPNVEALQIETRYPVYLAQKQLESNQVPDWLPESEVAKTKFDAIFADIVSSVVQTL